MSGPGSTVSVVIPAHDAEATVEAAILSALHQSVPPLEVVVVDDASSDGTGPLVAALATVHESVRLLSLAENGGVSAARNAGVAIATGRWIAFLDADDLWAPEKLERQLAFAAANPVLDMIGSYYRESFEGRDGAVRNEFWWPSALLVKREVIGALGFDPTWRVSELPEFFSRFDDQHRRDGVPEPLMRYRMNLSGLAHRSFLTERMAWRLIGENQRRRASGLDQVPFSELERWFREAYPAPQRIALETQWRGDRMLRRALIEASGRRFVRAALFGAAGAALNPRSLLSKRARIRSVGAAAA